MGVQPASSVVSLAVFAQASAAKAPQFSDRLKRAEGHLAALAEPHRPVVPLKRNAAPIAISAGVPLRAARLQDEALSALAAAIEAAELPPKTPLIEENHVLHLPRGLPTRLPLTTAPRMLITVRISERA